MRAVFLISDDDCDEDDDDDDDDDDDERMDEVQLRCCDVVFEIYACLLI